MSSYIPFIMIAMRAFIVLLLAVAASAKLAPLLTQKNRIPGRYIVKLKVSTILARYITEPYLHTSETDRSPTAARPQTQPQPNRSPTIQTE